MANRPLKHINAKIEGSSFTETFDVCDDTAREKIADLQYTVESFSKASVLSDGFKRALLDCFEHVAWLDGQSYDFYTALKNAIYADIQFIDAVYTQSGTIYDTNGLDDLKKDLVVTATYSNGSTINVRGYSLSGVLTPGISTITVTFGEITDTFTVNVTHMAASLESISAVFEPGAHKVLVDDALETLKPYTTVTAHYSDGTSQVVTGYVLSGTLAAGSNQITVAYNNRTTKITVTAVNDVKSIEAVFDNSAYITSENTLEDLRRYLTVTARYSNGRRTTVNDYTLSGSLSAKVNTITVTYIDVTTTFTVITATTVDGITASFNAQGNTVYTDDKLDALRQYLTVTAYYDGTSSIISNYSLSGELVEGQNTVTVTYGNKTTTFNVNAVDFYNVKERSLLNGNLQNVVASVDPNQENTAMYPSSVIANLGRSNRRNFAVLKGKAPYYNMNQTAVPTDYYPIPVPTSAINFSVNVKPNGRFIYVHGVVYNDDKKIYSNSLPIDRVNWTELTNGTFSKDIKNPGNMFLIVNSKYDASGSTYPSDPTSVAVSFTYVTSISVAFNQGNDKIYTTSPLSALKKYLTVTATDSKGISHTVDYDYDLHGTLREGTSSITVAYAGHTKSFNVNVTKDSSNIYNKFVWSLSNNDIAIELGNNYKIDEENGNICTNRYAVNRVLVVAGSGTKEIVSIPMKNANPLYRGMYPIPVPPTATSVSIEQAAGGSYAFAINEYKLENGKYTLVKDYGSIGHADVVSASFDARPNIYFLIIAFLPDGTTPDEFTKSNVPKSVKISFN